MVNEFFWQGFEKRAEEKSKENSQLKEMNSKLDILVQFAQSEQDEKQKAQHEDEKQQAYEQGHQEGQQSAADQNAANQDAANQEMDQAQGIINGPSSKRMEHSAMKGAPVSETKVQ